MLTMSVPFPLLGHGLGQAKVNVSLPHCHISLLGTTGFIGQRQLNSSTFHKRIEVTPPGILSRCNIQIRNDLAAASRYTAKFQQTFFVLHVILFYILIADTSRCTMLTIV